VPRGRPYTARWHGMARVLRGSGGNGGTTSIGACESCMDNWTKARPPTGGKSRSSRSHSSQARQGPCMCARYLATVNRHPACFSPNHEALHKAHELSGTLTAVRPASSSERKKFLEKAKWSGRGLRPGRHHSVHPPLLIGEDLRGNRVYPVTISHLIYIYNVSEIKSSFLHARANEGGSGAHCSYYRWVSLVGG